ncbi:MAG: CoA-binding protein [Caldimicrobium sp.]|nr:CoA-binding protein [Caldimicrobium sp.]MCX7874276.1 CoA-binding protein [Caldimicrobium sp.]MDW8093917.1 CoA-binding protein [Caldimicrobium sp.]
MECPLPDYSSLDPLLLEITRKYKRLVIVGASPKEDRPSFKVMKYLLSEGFEILPVNPIYPEILGIKTYPDLESIPEDFQPEVIIIFRRSSEVLPVVERALRLKPKVIWMQEGIVNEEAKALAESLGIKVVMNLCFKKVHQLAK